MIGAIAAAALSAAQFLTPAAYAVTRDASGGPGGTGGPGAIALVGIGDANARSGHANGGPGGTSIGIPTQ